VFLSRKATECMTSHQQPRDLSPDDEVRGEGSRIVEQRETSLVTQQYFKLSSAAGVAHDILSCCFLQCWGLNSGSTP
jgi:hypothetical protein